MDIKGVFDHIFRSELFKRMIKLGINEDLVAWTRTFSINQKIQIVIDGHENKEK